MILTAAALSGAAASLLVISDLYSVHVKTRKSACESTLTSAAFQGCEVFGFSRGRSISTNKGAIARAFAVPLLSDVDLQSRLQAQGYTNIQNLKHDGNLVTATASKDGQTT